jgi:hypothetical protein
LAITCAKKIPKKKTIIDEKKAILNELNKGNQSIISKYVKNYMCIFEEICVVDKDVNEGQY